VDEPRPELLVFGSKRRIGADATSPPPGANVCGVTHGRARPVTRRTVRSGRPLVDPRAIGGGTAESPLARSSQSP